MDDIPTRALRGIGDIAICMASIGCDRAMDCWRARAIGTERQTCISPNPQGCTHFVGLTDAEKEICKMADQWGGNNWTR